MIKAVLNFIKANKQEIITCSVFMFFALAFNVYRVESDGRVYYAFLEYTLHLPNPESFTNGYYNPGFQQSGCAYLYMPFYIIAYLFEKLLHINLNFNGITLRQVAINLGSNFYLALSIILTIKILKKLNLKYIVLPVLSILFSTSAFSVAVVQSSFSHTPDIFLITVFIYLFLTNEEQLPRRAFWLGALNIIMILVRYFNFVFMLPVIIYYFLRKDYSRLKYLLIGFLSFIWIIPAVFYVYNIYDRAILLASGNNYLVKSVGVFSIIPKYSLKYLLHPLHGLFIWSPVTILSALGLLVFPKTKEKLGYVYFGMWVLLLLIYGFFPSWSCGWSFSNRFLIGLFPVFIIGLSAFLEKYGKKAILIIMIFTFYSVALYLNWRLNITNGAFGTPGNAVESWIVGEADSSYDKKLNPKIFWDRLFETCRYKYLFKIIK